MRDEDYLPIAKMSKYLCLRIRRGATGYRGAVDAATDQVALRSVLFKDVTTSDNGAVDCGGGNIIEVHHRTRVSSCTTSRNHPRSEISPAEWKKR